MASKTDEFCIKNEEICIQNEGLCIQNEEFCIQIDELLQAANCSVGVNPSVAGRGKTGAGEIDEKRLWLLSLLPLNDAHGFRDNGNWGLRGGGTTLTPEAWGANAAESLEKIILRYRLDGMDLNIEQQRSKFAKYICSMFRHLNARMGPFPPGRGLTFTGTPYSQIWQSHSCGHNQSPPRTG